MELEEMQAAWTEMSSELEKQKVITNELIMKMTQDKYSSPWNHILQFERIGTVVCFGMLLYLLVNFGKMDTVALKLCGFVCVITLAVLPILSLRSILGMKKVNITTMTVKETLETFRNRKKQFIQFQIFNFSLSFVFMLAVLPVAVKLLKNKNLFTDFDNTLLIGIPFLTVLFIVFFWYIIRMYKRIFARSEELIQTKEI